MKQPDLVNFVFFGLSTAVLVFLSTLIFPANIVLGNAVLNPFLAALIVGFFLSAAQYLAVIVIKTSRATVRGEYSWPMVFFAVNVVGIWIIKRLAEITGLGVSSLVYVIFLAVVISLAEWAIAKLTQTMPGVSRAS